MESILVKISTIMEKVERNTRPKSSFYILLSKKNAKIRTQFNPLIELEASKKYEMALINLETYFSFPNIDATNNHFRYTPNADRRLTETRDHEWFDVFIPEGCYEITDVNDYLQRNMKERGHYNDVDAQPNISIEPNSNTLKSVLTIASNYKVDFASDNSIRTVL